MTQPTTAVPVSTDRRLLPILFAILAAHRPALRQARPFQRLCALTLGHLLCLGRHTVSQLLVALGLGSADWSAFYRLFSRARVNYDLLCACLFGEVLAELPATVPVVVVVDGLQFGRQRQCVGHLAALLPLSADGYTRAVPLRLEPMVGHEWEAGLAALRWSRAALDAAGQHAQEVVGVADGHFSHQYVWRSLPERTTLLARTAKNRNLWVPATPTTRRGRPPIYGAKAPKPQAWLTQRRGWRRTRLQVRGRLLSVRYRVEGPYLVQYASQCPLYLIVVAGSPARPRRRRRAPAYWLVNARRRADGQWELPYPATQLLAWAWQRWEIEVTHRELKSGFGLGEQQQWSAHGARLAPQWTAWSYSVLVLTGYRAWGLGPSPQPPPGRWWTGGRRWSLNRLWQALRREVWELGEFHPVWQGTGADWWQMADLLATKEHAVAGAERA